MAHKNVCVSFDYEHDKEYYYLLEAWNKNPKIPFWITNCTPSEIQTHLSEYYLPVLVEQFLPEQ